PPGPVLDEQVDDGRHDDEHGGDGRPVARWESGRGGDAFAGAGRGDDGPSGAPRSRRRPVTG
ncbi:hypothetical protein, partial [Streptomyces europaeiscabiei]|uniref:hypothetical protein n=1 Tax=Streptomyces europaeiscabiei TaxID=146819 RepID=UPI001ABF263F